MTAKQHEVVRISIGRPGESRLVVKDVEFIFGRKWTASDFRCKIPFNFLAEWLRDWIRRSCGSGEQLQLSIHLSDGSMAEGFCSVHAINSIGPVALDFTVRISVLGPTQTFGEVVATTKKEMDNWPKWMRRLVLEGRGR